MSHTDTQSSPQAPAPVAPRRSRWKSVFFGTALLLVGGVIGGIVASPGIGQGWRDGGPGWHRGGDYGPRDGQGRRGDDDRGQRGWHHGGPGFGGVMMSPGRIERMVDRALGSVDASTEQKQKVRTIAERTADDIFALRDKHLEGRKLIGEALAGPSVDRGKIEALRADQMKLADEASKKITQAVADAAEVLTPAQRAELAKRIEQRRRWFRG
jgi:Spy/CpxP family protein refolding chaperone